MQFYNTEISKNEAIFKNFKYMEVVNDTKFNGFYNYFENRQKHFFVAMF